jgi:glucosamine-6-phosphate deaminase
LEEGPVDLACVGVGENGHLAFNEPPADFATESPFTVVALDEVSRQQQVGEGWFARLADVPTHAMTMTVRRILKSDEIICLVPDARKARAVRDCFALGVVTPDAPASALNTHARTTVYVDRASGVLLPEDRISYSALLTPQEGGHVEG